MAAARPGHTLDRVVAVARTLDEMVAATVSPEWLAQYGPRADCIQSAMVPLHTAWQTLMVQARQNTTEVNLALLEAAVVALSGVALKTACDIYAIRTRHDPIVIEGWRKEKSLSANRLTIVPSFSAFREEP